MAIEITEQVYDVIPTSLAVKAMRDSGYKNAAYAIAELVDNSVQAGASCVEILCKEEEEFVSQRTRRRIQQIAVVDDGCGMNAETLRKALQFGNGERLDNRTGIGRFGMGLPNSSISQARRVEVWSWQDGCSNALYSYLDLGEIEQRRMQSVPPATPRALPQEWCDASVTAGTSRRGTLVLWSSLDKCAWKTATAIFKNSEYIIGRIYRYFLLDGKVRIRMASVVNGKTDQDSDALPNDPLYLMQYTSAPDPWRDTPMFDEYGEPEVISCRVDGIDCQVTVKLAVAKKDARQGHNPGGLPHGKHAGRNLGVSVIRAGRELELQNEWCIGYDPTERWWGAEVDFPPLLDEVFGVPNNKQGARALAEYAMLSMDQIADREGYGSEQELREAWDRERDPRLVLLKVKHAIERNLKPIRKAITDQRIRGEKRRRHEDVSSAEERGKAAAEERAAKGEVGRSDVLDRRPTEEKISDIVKVLENDGIPPEEARPIGEVVVGQAEKFLFYEVSLESPEFFSVRIKAGTIMIGLNTNHPAYTHLVALLKKGDQTDDIETLRFRMQQSYEGLKLLLESWARYEDELSDGPRRERAQDARMDWGRVARDFFRDD